MGKSDEVFEQSLLYAETALARMRQFRIPPHPRNFEFWYAYASCESEFFNHAVDRALESAGTLTDGHITKLSKQFLGNSALTESIDKAGGRTLDEIERVMAVLDVARESTSAYGEALQDLQVSVAGSPGREALRAIVEQIVRETRGVEASNRDLEERLVASRTEIMHLHESLAACRAETLTDALTGLANRKCFDATLAEAVRETREGGAGFALLMVDVDSFKDFNDRFGHLTGDHVLRLVAGVLKQLIGRADLAARFGGDEFTLLLSGASLSVATQMGHRIRSAIVGKDLVRRSTGEKLGRVTVSIGIAAWQADDCPQQMMERADRCLYLAKRDGRNRIAHEVAASPSV